MPYLRHALSLALLLTSASALPALAATPAACADKPCAYLDTSLTPEARAKDLVSRMTLAEKAAQMQDNAPAIPRLGLKRYGWWNEALHGVARAGHTTVYPQAIALAATWDPGLMNDIGKAIADEGRASHNAALARDPSGTDRYYGVNYWSPNINIFRDPRWGRGQETYGEDPYLTGKMGTAFVQGMQGDDPRYYRVIATAKHYAVHSGPESTRHEVDVKVSKHDEEDTYLPAFRELVTEGKVASVMCAYNRINGQPACASDFLLTDQLRNRWGFTGYVVSDCDAIADIQRGHHFTKTLAEAAAVSLKHGVDNDCTQYNSPPDAPAAGPLVHREALDAADVRLGGERRDRHEAHIAGDAPVHLGHQDLVRAVGGVEVPADRALGPRRRAVQR